MKFDIFAGRAQNMWAENRLLKFFMILLTMGFVAQGIMTYAAVRYKEVVIIPPNFKDEVSFINGVPSDHYIETIARDVAFLAFNYTPATVRNQYGALLTYYAPEDFSEASTFWYEQADRVETSKVGSTYSPEALEIDPVRFKFYMTGEMVIYSFDQILERERKTFTIHYELRRGRFSISSLEEGRR